MEMSMDERPSESSIRGYAPPPPPLTFKTIPVLLHTKSTLFSPQTSDVYTTPLGHCALLTMVPLPYQYEIFS